MAIYVDGEVCQIIEFQHVKPGKGGAFVRTKLRRLKADSTIEKTYRSGEKVEPVFLERKEYQFLFSQGGEATLMDLETYEQIQVDESQIGQGLKYVKEDTNLAAIIADGDTLAWEVPNFVELLVAQTDPGYKGDTVSGSGKPATLETGAIVQVPYHINQGDLVKVDTRTGSYLERIRQK